MLQSCLCCHSMCTRCRPRAFHHPQLQITLQPRRSPPMAQPRLTPSTKRTCPPLLCGASMGTCCPRPAPPLVELWAVVQACTTTMGRTCLPPLVHTRQQHHHRINHLTVSKTTTRLSCPRAGSSPRICMTPQRSSPLARMSPLPRVEGTSHQLVVPAPPPHPINQTPHCSTLPHLTSATAAVTAMRECAISSTPTCAQLCVCVYSYAELAARSDGFVGVNDAEIDMNQSMSNSASSMEQVCVCKQSCAMACL